MQTYNKQTIAELFELPFLDLIYKAQTILRQNFPANEIELSKILSVKTGGCPENCSYCTQSAHHKTGLKKESLSLAQVQESAKLAKNTGIKRFCIGAAWRSLHQRDLAEIIEMVKAIKAEGLEACATLGMITLSQAIELKEAGLDFYNHNLDTSPEYYPNIITTRTYQDRLDTIANVHESGINTCCGGIIGMGETREDRVSLLAQIANLNPQPKSVPINRLIAFAGTPLENTPPIEDLELVRTIAVARIILPYSVVRLSAGRAELSESTQILCFLAGANSIWLDEKLLTA
ncbi:MAG: biotin synthase BioB, partial [Pseudomonadota bacterium]